jgi:hypothetical protein
MPDVEVMQVIRVRLLSRGVGTEADPMRAIDQYWSMDGQYLAEYDPARPVYPARGKDVTTHPPSDGGES